MYFIVTENDVRQNLPEILIREHNYQNYIENDI